MANRLRDERATSFFSALNPCSRRSGVRCIDPARDYPDMRDETVCEVLTGAWNSDYGFWRGLYAAWEALVGRHHDVHPGDAVQRHGAKGVLDFTILPLVSRKLIGDSLLPDTHIIFKALAWTIALPVEVARFTASVALTLLVLPAVALVWGGSSCRTGLDEWCSHNLAIP